MAKPFLKARSFRLVTKIQHSVGFFPTNMKRHSRLSALYQLWHDAFSNSRLHWSHEQIHTRGIQEYDRSEI